MTIDARVETLKKYRKTPIYLTIGNQFFSLSIEEAMHLNDVIGVSIHDAVGQECKWCVEAIERKTKGI